MKPTEETPTCIKIGGFGGDRRVTLRFKRNSSMLEERGYRYALVLPVLATAPSCSESNFYMRVVPSAARRDIPLTIWSSDNHVTMEHTCP